MKRERERCYLRKTAVSVVPTEVKAKARIKAETNKTIFIVADL